jgi:hypothetical protein
MAFAQAAHPRSARPSLTSNAVPVMVPKRLELCSSVLFQQAEPPLPPSSDVWLPPQELQRGIVLVSKGTPYTSFFPIELNIKDYLRRIFDATAMGIQETVERVSVDYCESIGPIGCKKKKYDFNKTCDFHHLIKHIVHPKSVSIYAQGITV